jgi:hypothetical protein
MSPARIAAVTDFHREYYKFSLITKFPSILQTTFLNLQH